MELSLSSTPSPIASFSLRATLLLESIFSHQFRLTASMDLFPFFILFLYNVLFLFFSIDHNKFSSRIFFLDSDENATSSFDLFKSYFCFTCWSGFQPEFLSGSFFRFLYIFESIFKTVYIPIILKIIDLY